MNLAFATPDSARVSRTRAMAAVLGYSLAFAASFTRAKTIRPRSPRAGTGESFAGVVTSTRASLRRTVRDPFEDFYAQFFWVLPQPAREIRQTLQSLALASLSMKRVTSLRNQHVVERAPI